MDIGVNANGMPVHPLDEANNRAEKIYVTFTSEQDIIKFVDICNKIDDAIDVKSGKMSQDAKSILGMIQMPMEQELEVIYGCYDDEDNYEEFKELLKDGEIKFKVVM